MSGTEPRPTTVLVVDETSATRERLCSLLNEAEGIHAVGCGADAREALGRFAEVRPDCVLVDVPVHDNRGFETLAALRALDPTCLLVVLTNHDGAEFAARCASAGVDHFLNKATEFERTVDLVRALRESR